MVTVGMAVFTILIVAAVIIAAMAMAQAINNKNELNTKNISVDSIKSAQTASPVHVVDDMVAEKRLTVGTVVYPSSVGTENQVLTINSVAQPEWMSLPAQRNTNLSNSVSETAVTITSSTGADTIVNQANGTSAGVMSSNDYTIVHGSTDLESLVSSTNITLTARTAANVTGTSVVLPLATNSPSDAAGLAHPSVGNMRAMTVRYDGSSALAFLDARVHSSTPIAYSVDFIAPPVVSEAYRADGSVTGAVSRGSSTQNTNALPQPSNLTTHMTPTVMSPAVVSTLTTLPTFFFTDNTNERTHIYFVATDRTMYHLPFSWSTGYALIDAPEPTTITNIGSTSFSDMQITWSREQNLAVFVWKPFSTGTIVYQRKVVSNTDGSVSNSSNTAISAAVDVMKSCIGTATNVNTMYNMTFSTATSGTLSFGHTTFTGQQLASAMQTVFSVTGTQSIVDALIIPTSVSTTPYAVIVALMFDTSSGNSELRVYRKSNPTVAGAWTNVASLAITGQTTRLAYVNQAEDGDPAYVFIAAGSDVLCTRGSADLATWTNPPFSVTSGTGFGSTIVTMSACRHGSSTTTVNNAPCVAVSVLGPTPRYINYAYATTTDPGSSSAFVSGHTTYPSVAEHVAIGNTSVGPITAVVSDSGTSTTVIENRAAVNSSYVAIATGHI